MLAPSGKHGTRRWYDSFRSLVRTEGSRTGFLHLNAIPKRCLRCVMNSLFQRYAVIRAYRTATIHSLIASLAFATIYGTASLSGGSELAFIPGDACFPFWLYDDTIDSLGEGSQSVEYRYAPHSNPQIRPSIGYQRCELSLTKPQHELLRTAYDTIRHKRFAKCVILKPDDTGKLQPQLKREINPMYAFVYGDDVNIDNIHIGWRYNEHWGTLLRETNAESARHARYTSYARGTRNIAIEWRDASIVQPLHVEDNTLHKWLKEVPSRTCVPKGNIKIIIVPEEVLQDVLQKKAYTSFIAVIGDKLAFYTWSDDGEWVLEEP